jgi:hypothetical protein
VTRLERTIVALALLCLGMAAACACWGCAWRWDRTASSGDVVEFRCPAPCASGQQGGDAGPTPEMPGGGSRGGSAP